MLLVDGQSPGRQPIVALPFGATWPCRRPMIQADQDRGAHEAAVRRAAITEDE